MLNQLILVGRISQIKNDILEIKIPRSYKNENGEYDTDTIKVIINGNIKTSVQEYCKKGTLVGVKGRIETGNTVVAEKITFLSSSSSTKE